MFTLGFEPTVFEIVERERDPIIPKGMAELVRFL